MPPLSPLTLNLAMYGAGLLTLIVGDLLWLGVIMRAFYAEKLGHLMAPVINWGAAGVFYLVYALAVWWFVASPNLGRGAAQVALQGALFGAAAYAVYDLTNHATLRDWPWQVTLVDISWGAFLTMLMALAMTAAAGWMRG